MTILKHTRMLRSAWLVDGRADASVPVCPRCDGPLIQIKHRPVDRLLRLAVPVQRYRCAAENGDPSCSWEGLFPVQPSSRPARVPHGIDHERPAENRLHRTLRAVTSALFGSHFFGRKPPNTGLSISNFGDVSFEDMAQITLDAIGDAVLVVDPKGKVIYLNKVAEKMTGWPSELALGRPVDEVFFIIDGATRERAVSPSQRAIDEARVVELALGSVLVRRDGTGIAIEDSAAPVHNRLGKVAGAVIVFHDAGQSKTEIQKMNHLAQHDFLTGLPNRILLMERLTQAIGMAERYHKQIALMFIDLDGFKAVNDACGHAVGDHLLQEVGADIAACVRATDTVSRHGGDEFVILLTQIEEIRDPAQVAQKLLAKFAAPRVVDGHELQVTLSIGISVYPDNGLDADTLMRTADKAMYASKSSGGNGYVFYR